MGQENRLHPVLALGTGLGYGPSFPGSPPPSPFPVHQTASTPKRKPLSPKNSMSTPVNGFFDFENNSSAKISPTCCDCRCGCGGDYEWQAFDTEAYGQHILPSKHCQMSISKTWLRREGKGKGKRRGSMYPQKSGKKQRVRSKAPCYQFLRHFGGVGSETESFEEARARSMELQNSQNSPPLCPQISAFTGGHYSIMNPDKIPRVVSFETLPTSPPSKSKFT